MNMFLTFGKILKISSPAFVFKAFRKESINSSEVDPDYYLSALGYNWDAVVSIADVNLILAQITKSDGSLKGQ